MLKHKPNRIVLKLKEFHGKPLKYSTVFYSMWSLTGGGNAMKWILIAPPWEAEAINIA